VGFNLCSLHHTVTEVSMIYQDTGCSRPFHEMEHFIRLVEKATLKNLAKAFLKDVCKLHGLPSKIIPDIYAKFAGEFC